MPVAGAVAALTRTGSLADLVVFRLPDDRSRIEWLTTVAAGEVQFGSVVNAA